MKMTDADERALDVLDRLVQDLGSITEDDAIGLQNYLRARLAADQQKGGGEVGLPGSLITHRYVWRKALELAVFSADPAHAEKWNRELAAYDQTFDRLLQLIEAEMKWPDPQPSIPAPAQRADEVHADALRIIERDWFDYVDGPPAQQPAVVGDAPLEERIRMIVTMLRAEAGCRPTGYTFGEQAAMDRAGELANDLDRALHEVRVLGKSHATTAEDAAKCRAALTPAATPTAQKEGNGNG